MNTVSPEQVEITRRKGASIEGTILRRLAQVTQERAADCMGVHSSTVSRQKEGLGTFCQLLAALGLQVNPVDSIVTSQDQIVALENMAYEYLRSKVESRRMREGVGHA